MPPVLQSVGSEGFSVDPMSNTIRFERFVAAPPEAVFAAWTEPSHVECWWDPTGAPLTRCEIDLRVGGKFEFVPRSHPERPFIGLYRKIDPPVRLVFEALGAEGRVILKDTGHGTRMSVEIVCSSPEHLRQFIEMGVAVRTSQTLDNLAAYEGRSIASRL